MAVSTLSFSDAQSRVAGQLGLDSTDTGTATRLKAWLNDSYKDIAGNYEWSWLKDRESVEMIPDITTGTVTTVTDSTAITFTTGPTPSVADWMIQFSDADDWYTISTHTAGATGAVLDIAFIGTGAANLTYTLRKIRYSLSSSVEYVEDCKQAISNEYVSVISPRDYDYEGFPTDTADSVSSVVFWGQDSSNNWSFTPFPIPSASSLLEFRFVKAITELSATTDTCVFPPRFDTIWMNRAKMYGYEFLNELDMYRVKRQESDKDIQKMTTKDNVGKDEFNVLQPIDASSRHLNRIQFPSNYDERLR